MRPESIQAHLLRDQGWPVPDWIADDCELDIKGAYVETHGPTYYDAAWEVVIATPDDFHWAVIWNVLCSAGRLVVWWFESEEEAKYAVFKWLDLDEGGFDVLIDGGVPPVRRGGR